MMAVGVARPSAQGQAITKTATKTVSAKAMPLPAISQAAAATIAITATVGTNQPEITSASRAIGAFEFCACSIIRTIWESAVSPLF